MRVGLRCEECEIAVWLATTRAELHWLLSRVHVVREVRGHLSAGLDTWMDEGLTFIDAHDGHSVIVVTGGR